MPKCLQIINNPFQKVSIKFQKVSAWLSDSLTHAFTYSPMSSNKHNLITATMGLIFELFNVTSVWHMPFCQLQYEAPDQCLHHGCVKASPLLSFVLHLCWLGDDLQYTLWHLVQDLGKCSAGRGTPIVLFFSWKICSNCSKSWKQNEVVHDGYYANCRKLRSCLGTRSLTGGTIFGFLCQISLYIIRVLFWVNIIRGVGNDWNFVGHLWN